MTAINQDVEVYAGDDESVEVTITDDATGSALDVSAASEIAWKLYDGWGTQVLSKTKTTGGIGFVTDGTDGKIKIAIAGADTSALAGWYFHAATVTDGSSNVSTVESGRLLVKNRALGD